MINTTIGGVDDCYRRLLEEALARLSDYSI
jgi:hypothetical protein